MQSMKSIRLSPARMLAAGCVMAVLVAHSAQAQTYQVLHGFTGGTDGSSPAAGVTLDAKGNLYGTTPAGGDSACGNFGCGVVFRLSQTGHETLLHTFKNGRDGAYPYAGLIRDAQHNLYGTSSSGTVFRLSPTDKFSPLYIFKGGAPLAPSPSELIRDGQGNPYGTTYTGGDLSCGYYDEGCGVVFKLSPAGKKTVLHTFKGGTDGEYPLAGVVQDAQGNLYGTTSTGGSSSCSSTGCGAVFKLSKTGKETVLYTFTGGADGGYPEAGVILDAQGNLYGTAYSGGTGCNTHGCGVVFKLSKTGKETVLYTFTGGTDGANPAGGLILDTQGNLYGTTYVGGDSSCNPPNGCGVVFRLSKTGIETVLHSFAGGPSDGEFPYAGVIRDANGNLYGTTVSGGPNFDWGVVFKLTP
jgi:uncharacterized repeat protein (TIGR03803 family)